MGENSNIQWTTHTFNPAPVAAFTITLDTEAGVSPDTVDPVEAARFLTRRANQ